MWTEINLQQSNVCSYFLVTEIIDNFVIYIISIYIMPHHKAYSMMLLLFCNLLNFSLVKKDIKTGCQSDPKYFQT